MRRESGDQGNGFAGVSDKEVRGCDGSEETWLRFVEFDYPEPILFVVIREKSDRVAVGRPAWRGSVPTGGQQQARADEGPMSTALATWA